MMGALSISLDFELHWGGFEKWPIEKYRTYFLNTRAVIPKMLDLFDQYGVHVTWAGVGLLFHETKREILEDLPSIRPTYKHANFSAYQYMETKGIGDSEKDDPFHYGMSLLRKIQGTKGQEIGSHTFSHYYCNEEGQTSEQFKHDLLAAQKAATRLGIAVRSLVFPRNQFNDEYLKVCHEAGFEAVRSNPPVWFWDIQSVRNESYWKRLNRGADAYLPTGPRKSFPLESLAFAKGRPLCIPASRLLRPYRRSELFLNRMKIQQIKRELRVAAQHHEVYHLWWHPHNFGHYPKESLLHLEEILRTFSDLRRTTGMESMNMGELRAAAVSNIPTNE